MAINIHIQHYAELAAVVGSTDQAWCTEQTTLRGVYQELQQRYAIRFSESQIKPVRNDSFVAWEQSIESGDVIAFLPPFSGG
jgi:sulfur-carrier protein